jgi:serine/threonine protein kinase
MNFTKVPALPRGYSENMKQIIGSMLTTDASKRPTINDLLAHPAINPRITKFMTDDEILKEFNADIPKGNILKIPIPSASPSAPSTPSTPSSSRPGSARSIKDPNEERKVLPRNVDSRGFLAPKPYEPMSRAIARKEESKGLKSSGEGPIPISSRDRRGSKDAIKPAAPKVVAQTPKFGMGARK